MKTTSILLFALASTPLVAFADDTKPVDPPAPAQPTTEAAPVQPTAAPAQPAEAPAPVTHEQPALRMSAEIDPADYTIYRGWGGFIGIHPRATGQWRFRIGGGAAHLPDVAVQNTDNNKNWHQELNPVVTFAAHYYFGHGRGGFFAGPVTGWSSITFTAPSGGSVDVRNVFVGADIGYRWFPSDKIGLVITPHLGAIVPIYKSTEPVVGMEKYDLLPVIPMPQLLIGYELDVLK